MSHGSNRRVITVSDPVALANMAAQRLLARIEASGGRIAICLTGGSSPQKLYQLLATVAWRSKLPWPRVHWFIGDERFVRAEDPLNNMGMARRVFLDRCAPAANVHPIPTDNSATPEEAAQRYEEELKSFNGAKALEPSIP
jgi:6-phosphogluconolactonase